MDANESVVHVEQGNRMNVIFNLLAVRIGQAGEPAHIHPHVEILALHKAGADVLRFWAADDVDAFGAKTFVWAVALLPFGIVAVNLHQLRVVDVRRERIRYSRQIHLVAVRGLGRLFLTFRSFHFRPSGFCRLRCNLSAPGPTHSYQTAFPANFTALSPHCGHNLREQRWILNHCQGFAGLSYFNDVVECALGVLDHVRFRFATALWHTLSVARQAQICQEGCPA